MKCECRISRNFSLSNANQSACRSAPKPGGCRNDSQYANELRWSLDLGGLRFRETGGNKQEIRAIRAGGGGGGGGGGEGERGRGGGGGQGLMERVEVSGRRGRQGGWVN